MRWKIPKYRFGDKRIVTKFLLLPKRIEIGVIEEEYETRWLEKASWEEIYTLRPGATADSYSWVATRWV